MPLVHSREGEAWRTRLGAVVGGGREGLGAHQRQGTGNRGPEMDLVQANIFLRGLEERTEAINLGAQRGLPLAGRFQLVVDRATLCGIEISGGDGTHQPLNLRAADAGAECSGKLGVDHLRQAAKFPLDRFGLPHQCLEDAIFGTLRVDKVVTVHLRFGLELAINAAVALLQTVGIPGHVKVEQVPAVRLQVQPFAGRVGGNENADRVFTGVRIERLADLLPLRRWCGTVIDCDPLRSPVAPGHGGVELLLQVPLCVVIFGKDEDAGVVPRRPRLAQGGAHVLAHPVEEGADPRIGQPTAGLGDRRHGVEQILLMGEQGLGGRVGSRPRRGRRRERALETSVDPLP